MISVSSVNFGKEEEELVLQVLRSGQLAQGPMVLRFEELFSELHQVDHAIAVNNGTTALVASLRVLGLQTGDEVITSPFSFVATLNAIIESGATARFADIGDDFNLIPSLVDELVNERTKVLMPVHLYGLPVEGDAFTKIARSRDLEIVEDAAQAVGASFGSTGVGGLGLGCFSLYATKNLTTGEGGVITTNNALLAEKLRLLRNQGMRARYEYEMAGSNYRLTDLAAAVGIPQLARLASTTKRRQENARSLRSGLEGIPGLVLPSEPIDGRTHVFHQFTVRVTEEANLVAPQLSATPGVPTKRDALLNSLTSLGIGCGVYYPKLTHDYTCFNGHPQVKVDPTPNANRVVGEVLSLPIHPGLSPSDILKVVDGVRTVMGAA